MRTDTAKPIRLTDYRPTDYVIDSVGLEFNLQPEATRVRARLSLAARPATKPGTPLELNGDELDLVGLALDGAPLADDAYTARPDALVIHRPPAGRFELEILTRADPSKNTKLMGLYRTGGTYCTQCEAEGFRRITYFLDRPDVLAVYTTRIEARKSDAPLLLSNGNRVEAGEIAGTDRHYAVWHDPFPKPSYLFALVAGDLADLRDTFVTGSGRRVALHIYVEHGKQDRAHFAMDALKRSMAWDEAAFGREYDLDIFMIVAVSDFNMGAMENKGLNIFNDRYVLADPETATDQDYANIEGVIAHEYFHNWTGNRITCRDWFQLCLKEGLTVYRDQEFSADQRSRAVKRISDVRLLMAHQFPEDAGPLAHPVRPTQYSEINNFYTATVYEKGAELVRMIATILGEDGFANGMKLYFDRHDGEATTIETFLACFSEATGADLDQFALWYHQSGTPRVTARVRRDTDGGGAELTLTQSCPPTPGQADKAPFHIPLRFGIVTPPGEPADPALPCGVLHLRSDAQTHRFENVPREGVFSLNRGFTAPIILDAGHSEAELTFLAANDPDPFNRWQAAQTLCHNVLGQAVAALRGGGEPPMPNVLGEVLRSVAGEDGLEDAFKALVLTLPSETDIARTIGSDIDTDAVHDARLTIKRRLGPVLTPLIADRQAAGAGQGDDFDIGAEAAGRRAFDLVLFDYLAAGGADGQARILQRYQAARNMTVRFGLLTALVQSNSEHADAALADFYEAFRHDPLVLDKWFTAQATAPGRQTLDRVEALTRHPAFTFSNPNRVRALVGGFAAGNQVEFNRADGQGYRFVIDVCIALDRTNPQVAARLLSAFRSWRSLEPGRRGHAEAQLRRLLDSSPQSADVIDIVNRSLQ